MSTPFADDIRAVLEELQPGEVVTYGEVARRAGRPWGARGVASVLRSSDGLAWWRVVNAAGRVYPGASAEATRRLRTEGVVVEDGFVRREAVAPGGTSGEAGHCARVVERKTRQV